MVRQFETIRHVESIQRTRVPANGPVERKFPFLLYSDGFDEWHLPSLGSILGVFSHLCFHCGLEPPPDGDHGYLGPNPDAKMLRTRMGQVFTRQ
jgi:hypothetical protein